MSRILFRRAACIKSETKSRYCLSYTTMLFTSRPARPCPRMSKCAFSRSWIQPPWRDIGGRRALVDVVGCCPSRCEAAESLQGYAREAVLQRYSRITTQLVDRFIYPVGLSDMIITTGIGS